MHTRAFGPSSLTDPIDTRMDGGPAWIHAIQAFPNGGPTAANFIVYGSTKSMNENPAFPGDYAALGASIDGVAVPLTFIANKPVNTLIIQIGTITGGTSPSVAFGYCGSGG